MYKLIDFKKLGFTILASVLFALTLNLSISSHDVLAAPSVPRYVAPAPFGSDTSDCTNAAFPCATVQYAIDWADEGDEVRVAQGTYTGVNSQGGLSQMVYVSKTVTIRGGYTTTDWTASDPDAHPTILDAQGQGRVLYVTGDISPTIEGLWITGGDATGLGGGVIGNAGSGVMLVDCNTTLKNNTIFSNTTVGIYPYRNAYGGGIFVDGGHNTIVDNTIYSNSVQVAYYTSYNSLYASGGGIYVAGPSVLNGNVIYANTVKMDGIKQGTTDGSIYGYGGGVYADEAMLVSNSIFSNTVEAINSDSRDSVAYGGGVYATRGASLVNNDIHNNTCFARAIVSGHNGQPTGEAYGSGVYVDSEAEVSGNTVLFNTATAYASCTSGYYCYEYAYVNGSGVYVSGNSITFTDNLVSLNMMAASISGSAQQGGDAGVGSALYSRQSGGVLHNNVITGNESGGLWIHTAYSPTLSNNVVADNAEEGIYVSGGGSPTFLHTTIARNDDVGVYVVNGTATFTNTIIVSHTTGVTVTAGGSANLNYTLWHDNGLDAGGSGALWRTHDLAGDPAFAPDGYHLTGSSAAIDRGVDTGIAVDIDGGPRDAAPDLGADEFSFCYARVGEITYDTVQDAVDAASDGDVVKIAGYCMSVDSNPVAHVTKTVTLRGGYTTTNWTVSDPDAYPSTLDAQGQGRVLYVAGSISPTIEGLRITGGYLDEPGNGAGIYANVTSIAITRCVIISNTISWANDPYGKGRGAGAYVAGGQATLADNTILHNIISATIPAGSGGVQGYGGGLFLGSATQMSQNAVNHNHLYGYDYGGMNLGGFYGAGIHATRALTMSGDVVAGNTISATGGSPGEYVAVYARGGGLWAQGALHLSGAIVARNVIKTPHYLTSAYLQGAGIYVQNDKRVDVTNAVIADNQIDSNLSGGAGLYAQYSGDLHVRHATIARNVGGTGLRVPGGTLTNIIVVSHTTGVNGGSSATLDGVLWYDNDANAAGAVTVTHAYTDVPAFAPDGYHLTEFSAALDRGVDAAVVYDIDGDVRDEIPDLGADEYVPPLPIFEVRKDAQGATVAGLPFTYTITITNSGNLIGTNVVVTDAVPTGSHYISGGSESGGIVTLDVGTVLTDSPSSVTWMARACQSVVTNEWYRVITSTEGVGSDWGPALTSTFSAPVIALHVQADINLSPALVHVGDTIHFTSTSSTDGSPIVSWRWDWGDGQSDDGETASHAYTTTGVYTVTLTATDLCGYTGTVSFAVTVDPAPCVEVIGVTIDGPTKGVTGTVYTFTGVVTPADASVPITYTWTPAPISGQGTSTVTYQWAGPGSYTITLLAENYCGVVSDTHIIAFNNPPVAVDDVAETDEDTPVVIDVLANDDDVDGDTLTVTSVTQPDNGVAEITDGGGSVFYTPDGGYVGDDSFTYTISDGNGGTDTATVTVTVDQVNSPPVAVDDVVETDQDTLIVIDVLANDYDVDGDDLIVVSMTQPINGMAEIPDVDSGVFYVPDEGYVGEDSFTYTISDGNGGTDTATVYITVKNPDDTSLTDVSILGASEGVTNTDYIFTSDIAPFDASKPVVYTWSPTPANGQGMPAAIYNWSEPGVYTLTLWAENSGGLVSDTHVITIWGGGAQEDTPLTSVSVLGASEGMTNTDYIFASDITPFDASRPIAYTWSPMPVSGQGMPVAIYNWTEPGVYTLTIWAENSSGLVSDTHVVTINGAITETSPVPWGGVTIDGSTEGVTDTEHAFTAVVTPTNVTRPITYTWSPEPVSGQGTETAVFRWAITGTYTLTLWAENYSGVVSDTHVVVISAPQPTYIYLPLVARNFSTGPQIHVLDDAPDACVNAHPVVIGDLYQDNFDRENDNDWYSFEAVAGTSYVIQTGDLEARSDTTIALYDRDCETRLAENDDVDWPNDVSSRIEWTAPHDGVYNVVVYGYDWRVYGEDTGYTFSVDEGAPAPAQMQLQIDPGDEHAPKPTPPPTPQPVLESSSVDHRRPPGKSSLKRQDGLSGWHDADSPPTVRYVTVSGSDTSDCTNAAFPCATVQYAVGQADAGDEVLVAQGTYTGVNGRGGLSQMVYLSKTVTIRGGYTTTNWTTPDVEAYPTILDAQGQGRVLYVTGDVSPTIEGLWITGGDASGLGGDPIHGSYDAGGGVALIDTNATLSNTVIFNNTVSDDWALGGGLFVDGGRNTIAQTVICSNTIQADGSTPYIYARGGGVYVAGPANVLTGNEIYANLAWADMSGSGIASYANGGGVYVDGASLIDNIIDDNLAHAVTPDAAYARAYGGGVCATGAATLVDNDVRANTALASGSNNAGRARGEAFGGGVYVGYIAGLDAGGTVVDRNVVLSNTASASASCVGSYDCAEEAYARGGGVYIYLTQGVTLTQNVVSFNGVTATINGTADGGSHSQMRGGGMYVDASNTRLDANVVAANEARRGGGLYFCQIGLDDRPELTNNVVVDNASDGVYLIGGGSLSFLHTTVARNDGTGIHVAGGKAILTNTIVVSHTVGVTVAAGCTANLDYTLWSGNVIDGGGPGALWRTHNYVWGDADLPAFAPDGYHLTASSAARDRGVDAGIDLDIDGQSRDGTPDLGADEYTPLTAVYLPLTARNASTGSTGPAPHILDDAPDACVDGYPVQFVDEYRDDFDHENDNDWYAFEATAGLPYRIWTFDLAPDSDTFLALYAADCQTLLAESDDVDWPDDVSSRIDWMAPEDGGYCVQVRHHDGQIYGAETAYTFSILPIPPLQILGQHRRPQGHHRQHRTPGKASLKRLTL